ncbi:hypothetical protein FACS1894132_10810 [Clostridia bacterium]|nr:hypothetical protein FACS1894132_10810 [Clostridia bacterium]
MSDFSKQEKPYEVKYSTDGLYGEAKTKTVYATDRIAAGKQVEQSGKDVHILGAPEPKGW